MVENLFCIDTICREIGCKENVGEIILQFSKTCIHCRKTMETCYMKSMDWDMKEIDAICIPCAKNLDNTWKEM